MSALNRRQWLTFGVAGLALGLAACATPGGWGASSAAEPSLTGRIALNVEAGPKTPAQDVITGFRLTGAASAGTLTLDGALGTTALFIRWSPEGARLVRGDGLRDYPSLDDLTRDALGESLPLAALFDWLQGHPSAAAPWQAQPGEPTPPLAFSQLGWQVDARQLATQRLLTAHRLASASGVPGVKMRLKLDSVP